MWMCLILLLSLLLYQYLRFLKSGKNLSIEQLISQFDLPPENKSSIIVELKDYWGHATSIEN
jgi:hypothetical protein